MHRITGMRNFPLPLQRPHPPILIGAGGRRMLAIAAREADIVGTVEQIAEQMFERRERFGVSYYMTFDHMMEAYAPLVERLAGR